MRGANDSSFFLYQYIPHEIIKKLSWLTFHPLYLKAKLEILHIINNLYEGLCKKKGKVNPQERSSKPKRFTAQVRKFIFNIFQLERYKIIFIFFLGYRKSCCSRGRHIWQTVWRRLLYDFDDFVHASNLPTIFVSPNVSIIIILSIIS